MALTAYADADHALHRHGTNHKYASAYAVSAMAVSFGYQIPIFMASFFIIMTLDHISLSLIPQCQMASAGITLGPASSKKRKVYASVRFIFERREIFLFSTILINKFHIFPCSFSRKVDQRILADTMAEENIPAPAPTRTDEQILPYFTRLHIRKGNLLLDLQKLQKNPMFPVLKNTLTHDAKTGVYSFQLNEQWFTLSADLLRKALDITLVNSAHPFVSPPAGEANVDYAELLWKDFVQGFQTFFSHQTNLNVTIKKSTPHVIPYYRFTKMIIYYLGNRHNIHRRSESPMHATGDELPLGNLKFVPKGEKDEAFGMPIPKELITEAIQHKEKSSFKLVDEEEEVQPSPEPHVDDDEYSLQRVIQMRPVLTLMAPDQSSSGPALYEMTTATHIAGLLPKPPSSATFVPPTRNDWDTLLQPLFDEYSRTQPNVDASNSEVATPVPAVSTSTPSSTSVDQDAP
ncbi:hypothetical protein Tco_0880970 [Tanacetum coccineum]